MKRILMNIVMAFGLGSSLFMATPASAQSNNPAIADIPFAFVIKGHTLPAGTYRISQLNDNSSVFTFSGKDSSSLFASLGNREAGQPNHPSVTFARSGGDWVLVKIAPPDSVTSYSLRNKDKSHNLQLSTMISIKLK